MNKPTASLVILAASLAALSGCAGPIVERSIPSNWIGSDRARLSIYMGVIDKVEEAPGDIAHEVVRDDATLTKVSATETCFSVSTRTSTEFDEPLDMMSPTCSLDGDEVQALVSSESVKTAEYAFGARVETVRAEGRTPGGSSFSYGESEPETRVFRVNERSAEICCPGGGTDVKLRFHSPRMKFNNLAYAETFAWRVL